MRRLKLSTVVILLVVATFFFTSCNQESKVDEVIEEVVKVNSTVSGEFTANVEASSINWLGKKVTGEHSGTISLSYANFILKNGQLISGKAKIDMATIVVTDIEDAEMNAQLKEHLDSKDFFNTSEFQAALLTFESSSEANTFTGEIILKGITNPVTFTAEVMDMEQKPVLKGTIVIDRTEYDIKYGSGKFFEDLGDKTINDEFELTFTIVAQ